MPAGLKYVLFIVTKQFSNLKLHTVKCRSQFKKNNVATLFSFKFSSFWTGILMIISNSIISVDTSCFKMSNAL